MTKEELLKSKEKFIWLTKEEESDLKFKEHFKKYDFFHTDSPKVMGQYFLYEIFDESNRESSKLSYPKLAVYLNSLPCDQTIEVEFVNYINLV